MFGARVPGTPFQEEAGGEAAEHSQDPKSARGSDSALVVGVGDIQSLVQAVFDTPGQAVVRQPLLGVELGVLEAGDQAYDFVAFAFDLTSDAGDLGGERKADVFGLSGMGAKGTRLASTFVPLDLTGQLRCWLQRGKNLLEEPPACLQCSDIKWVGCL